MAIQYPEKEPRMTIYKQEVQANPFFMKVTVECRNRAFKRFA